MSFLFDFQWGHLVLHRVGYTGFFFYNLEIFQVPRVPNCLVRIHITSGNQSTEIYVEEIALRFLDFISIIDGVLLQDFLDLEQLNDRYVAQEIDLLCAS